MAKEKEEVQPEAPVERKPARFISGHRKLTLWVEPILEIRTATGYAQSPGTGKKIEFTEGTYKTDDPDTINWLINHKLFMVDFYPFPEKGDWWEANGWFKTEHKEVLSPIKKAKQMKEVADKIIADYAKSAAAEITTRRKSTSS